MKELKFVTAFACALCSLVSCSSDDMEDVSKTSSGIETVKVAYIDANGNITNSGEVQNQVLCFESEAKYNDFVQKLKGLSDEDKEKTFNDLGFTNLIELAKIADRELDSISENSSNEAEFRSRYKCYVSKYAESLTTNSFDSLDLTLYVPASFDEKVDPYLVGVNKMIVINGNVHKIKFKSEMNSVDKKLFGDNMESNDYMTSDVGRKKAPVNYKISQVAGNVAFWGTNSFKGWIGRNDRGEIKLIVHTDVLKDGEVQVHFGAQVSTWYGSKRISIPMFVAVEDIKGFEFNPGISSNNSYMISMAYVDPFTLDNSCYYGITTNKLMKKKEFCLVGNEEHPIGCVENKWSYHVTGNIYVWARMDFNVKFDGYYHRSNFYGAPCVRVALDHSK